MSDEQTRLDKQRLLADDINFRITSLLIVYDELSLSELTRRVRGSKSTAHRHLAVLMDNGLIEVSRELKVRSDRKAKYYRLTERAYDSLGLIESAVLEEKLQAAINYYLYYKTFIDEFLEFLREGDKKEQVKRFKDIESKHSFDFRATFLTEDDLKELKRDIGEVFERFRLRKQEGSLEKLRPYFFMSNFLPFKEMLDSKNPKTKPK
jgi:DNA-binding transcriptional ArsR family regulator